MEMTRRGFVAGLIALTVAPNALELLARIPTNQCDGCNGRFTVSDPAFDADLGLCSPCYERQRLIIEQMNWQGQQAINAMARMYQPYIFGIDP